MTGLVRSLSDMFGSAWSTLGGFFGVGGYNATDPRRKILPTGMRPQNATANQLLTSSLSGLRAYCRHLERNNPTARAAIEGLVANVVGTGIDLAPDTGDQTTNERLSAAWADFRRDCVANGHHDLFYLQTQSFRDVVAAGEFLWRFLVLPDRVDSGRIPLCVLPLECEWLDQTANTVGTSNEMGVTWVGGVAFDKLGNGVAYRLRNPELPSGECETVSAAEINHGFERRRALQARGEPWFAPVIETLQQEHDLIDAELKAAVNTASMAMVITSDAHGDVDTTNDGTTDDPAQTLRIGSVARMYPGEKVEAFSHTRPSQQIAPFRQMLRGDIAAAMRIPQRFLDRDVSRANYSSMRADMLDSDRLLAPVREWFGHATAGRLYLQALPYLCLKAGVRMPRSTAYRLLPDGQPYVDPVKDAEGAITAICGGLSTFEKEISKRGEDPKKLLAQLTEELKNPIFAGIFAANQKSQPPAPAESNQAKEPANG